LIVCADLHLRHDKPVARTDAYWLTQSEKFQYILSLARQNPPLIVAGDFFHKARPPIPLIRWVMDTLLEYDVIPIVVPGQHDLPWHSLEHIADSGIGLLQAAGLVDILTNPSEPYFYKKYALFGCPFGQNPWPIPDDVSQKDLKQFTKILIWHHLVIRKGEELWPGQKATVSGKILRTFRHYDYILTGDNHQAFIETARNRRHINPGSMCRMAISQLEHRPRVYDIEKDEFVYIPIREDVFDLALSQSAAERESRIANFVEHLNAGYEVGVDFERNLIRFMDDNSIGDKVRNIVLECLYEK